MAQVLARPVVFSRTLRGLDHALGNELFTLAYTITANEIRGQSQWTLGLLTRQWGISLLMRKQTIWSANTLTDHYELG